MKKYQSMYQIDQKQATKQRYDELRLFQFLLYNVEELDEHFHGKAHAIADGLTPWIETLEQSLKS